MTTEARWRVALRAFARSGDDSGERRSSAGPGHPKWMYEAESIGREVFGNEQERGVNQR